MGSGIRTLLSRRHRSKRGYTKQDDPGYVPRIYIAKKDDCAVTLCFKEWNNEMAGRRCQQRMGLSDEFLSVALACCRLKKARDHEAERRRREQTRRERRRREAAEESERLRRKKATIRPRNVRTTPTLLEELDVREIKTTEAHKRRTMELFEEIEKNRRRREAREIIQARRDAWRRRAVEAWRNERDHAYRRDPASYRLLPVRVPEWYPEWLEWQESRTRRKGDGLFFTKPFPEEDRAAMQSMIKGDGSVDAVARHLERYNVVWVVYKGMMETSGWTCAGDAA